MFYVLNGVLREEVYQLYVFTIAVSAIVIYCVIEYIVNADGRTEIKLVSKITVCTGSTFGYLYFFLEAFLINILCERTTMLSL